MALWDELQNPAPGLANGSPVTATFASAPTAGNLLVAVAHADAAHNGPPSGWSTASPSTDGAASGVWGAIYWKIAAGTEGAVSVAATGAGRARLHIFEFDTAGQTVSLDSAATPNGNSTNVASWQVPSLAVDGLSVVAVLTNNNVGTWGTFDSGYVTTSTHTGGGANPASAVGTRVVTGTVAPTITWSTGRMPTGMHVSFKVAGAPPTQLEPDDSTHAHAASSPSVAEVGGPLAIESSSHGHTAEAVEPAHWLGIDVTRVDADEASVAINDVGADRYIVEHYRGETLVADYDPAANPQTVVNVEDGDLVRVGAVTEAAFASLDDPTFAEADHRPVTGRRQIVRTSDGTLWLVNQVNESAGNDAIAVWRWSGTDWVVQDYSGGPRGNTIVDPQFNDIGLVVDSNDVLHIVAPSGGANVVYVRFDTDTGQFEGQEQIEFPVPVGQEVAQVDLAIDSGDDLHLIGLHNDDGFTSHDLYYARRSSGSWSEPELVDTQTSNYWQKGAVQVDSLGQVVIVASFGTTLMAYRSGFGWDSHAVTTVASRGGINAPGQLLSAVIDANDDVWVAYVRSDLTVGLVRHDSEDDWDTWETPVTNGEDATSVAVGLLDGVVQVLWIDGASVATNTGHVWHDAYDGSWAGATEVITEDAGFPGVAVHWQQHNFTPQGLEFIWWDGTKPVHASLSEPSETVLWSRLVPIPDFTGDTLTPQDSTHGHTAEAVTFSQRQALVPQGSEHGHTAGVSTLGQAHALTVADSLHGHAAQAAPLSLTAGLTPESSVHAHEASAPAVTQAHVLAPQDSEHGHVAEAVPSGQTHTLAPQNSTHAHTATAAGSAQVHILAPQNSVHGHTASTVLVGVAGALTIEGSRHRHHSTAPSLTQHHTLTVASAVHGHTSTGPTAGVTHHVTPQASVHGHESSAVTLGEITAVEPSDAAHGHTASSPALGQVHALQVLSSVHAHAAQAGSVIDVSGRRDITVTVSPPFSSWAADLQRGAWSASAPAR